MYAHEYHSFRKRPSSQHDLACEHLAAMNPFKSVLAVFPQQHAANTGAYPASSGSLSKDEWFGWFEFCFLLERNMSGPHVSGQPPLPQGLLSVTVAWARLQLSCVWSVAALATGGSSQLSWPVHWLCHSCLGPATGCVTAKPLVCHSCVGRPIGSGHSTCSSFGIAYPQTCKRLCACISGWFFSAEE